MGRHLGTAAPAGAASGAADRFLACLVTQDFAGLGDALADDAKLRALLPGGLREWRGAADVAHRFERWFGDTERYEVHDCGHGEVGDRTRLHWRLRLQAERLGPRPVVAEQVAFADVEDLGLIARIDLLCSGYRQERDTDG